SFLDRVFSATPTTLSPPQTLGDSVDLSTIANAYQMSQLYPINDIGAAEQLNNTVYDVRSFDSSRDFYLTLQELDVQNGADPFKYVGSFSFLDAAFVQREQIVPLLSNPTLLEPSPQSNPGTSSYTNSSTVTVGGSIGVNESQGLNAQLNASVSVSNSQTVTVPPITIAYRGDLLKASPNWAYFFRDTPTPGDSTSFYDQWIWRVPFSSYPTLSIPSQPKANQNVLVRSYAYYQTNGEPNVHNWEMAQLVPKPFLDTYQLEAPEIIDVSPLRVFAGSKFTITGF